MVMPNWHYLHIHNDVIPGAEGARRHRRTAHHDARRQSAQDLREAGRLLRWLPCRRSHPSPHSSPRLAESDPDAPAVTCAGRTLTRIELDSSTNRLARVYAELGVGQGDYVTIVLPNSIEWAQAVLATWKLGAVPQPLSARLPDVELGRTARAATACPAGRARRSEWRDTQPGRRFHARSGGIRRTAARGGVAGLQGHGIGRQHRAAQAHRGGRRQPVPSRAAGYPLGAQEGDVHLLVGAVVAQHRVHHIRDRPGAGSPYGADAAVRRRTSSCSWSPNIGSRFWRRCRRSCNAYCRYIAPARTPTTCLRSGGSGIWPHRARR